MKNSISLFLQVIVVMVGVIALVVLIKLPLTEGRAADLDVFNVYADPLVIYGYLASTFFFAILYQIFKLLIYSKQKKTASLGMMRSLRIIKCCGIILSILIGIMGLYIKIFHAQGDDPAGFLALSILAIIFFMMIAAIAAILEKNLLITENLKLKRTSGL